MKKGIVWLGILFCSFHGCSAWIGGAGAADPAAIAADTDADGLPDWWEKAYFGNLDQGPGGDPDRDGYSNLTEFRIGTNPADGLEAPVPAGNFFKYDAFGRIVEQQITPE